MYWRSELCTRRDGGFKYQATWRRARNSGATWRRGITHVRLIDELRLAVRRGGESRNVGLRGVTASKKNRSDNVTASSKNWLCNATERQKRLVARRGGKCKIGRTNRGTGVHSGSRWRSGKNVYANRGTGVYSGSRWRDRKNVCANRGTGVHSGSRRQFMKH